MPFENDVQDKRAFIENVYKELFEINMQELYSFCNSHVKY